MPRWRSHQAITLDHGKKMVVRLERSAELPVGLAGATSGAATGAEIVGVVGFVVGSVGGQPAVLQGNFRCAATGGVTGAKLGEVVDQRGITALLDDHLATITLYPLLIYFSPIYFIR
jgi:hypothetical protein